MNADCRTFEAQWNRLLEARGEADGVLEQALDAHATACPRCRDLAARYRTFRAALGAWEARLRPEVDLTDRVLTAWTSGPAPRRLSWPTPFVTIRWAAAATVLFLLGVVAIRGVRPTRPPEVASAPPILAPGVTVRPLSEAFTDATRATLDLARAASEPAARIGRQMLASAMMPEEPQPLPMPDLAEPEPAKVIRSVGEEVNQGVRPLSGSARQAFRFLLGPTLKAETSPLQPGQGA